jgi:excisionase family DNA binding protein
MSIEKLLTLQQAAAVTQNCEKTLRRRIDSGHLVAYKVGRQIRIKESDLLSSLKPMLPKGTP